VQLLRRHCFNRTDRLCFLAPWGDPCPCQGGDNLDAMLLSHVLGEAAPEVTVDWGPTNKGNSGSEVGRFRVGTYSPRPGTGLTVYAVVDFDGSGSHSAPLVDPLGAALALMLALGRLGLACHLEKSASGAGWHVWIFFAEAVPATDVRRLLFSLLVPSPHHLTDGTFADPKGNRGIEVFPKQDTLPEGGTGNQVWLPWWADAAAEGGNQFHRLSEVGLVPYTPEDFTPVSPADLAKALAATGAAAAGHAQSNGRASDNGASGRRVPAETILRYALAHAGGRRNDTGLRLCCQLRDAGYSEAEARPVVLDYRERVRDLGDHEYSEAEALATLRSAYSRPPREPWRTSGGEDGPHLTDRGNAIRLAREHGSDLRHCHPWGKWHAWDGRHWRGDDTAEVTRRAKQVVADLFRQAADQLQTLSLFVEGKADGSDK
jgi:hypothetical protein